MKVNRLLIKLFVILTLFSTAIFARGEVGGSLKSGEEKIVKPQNHHALSITKSRGKFSSSASYNVTLSNGGDIIYEDINQQDDIYLVFHNDVLAGDRMKIHVNRGYFDYKITPLQALPKVVKNVLEPEVLERAKKQKKVTKKRSKKVKPTPVIESKTEEILPLMKSEEADLEIPKLESDISYKDPIGKGFFEKFTKIFEELVKSLSLKTVTPTKAIVPEPKEVLATPEKTLTSTTPKSVLPHFNDAGLQSAAARAENRFSVSQRGIDRSFDDIGLKSSAILERSAFSAPQRGLLENFNDSGLRESARVSTKVFTAPKEISLNSQLPSGMEEKFSGLRSREPKLYKEEYSKQKEQVPTFKTFESIATNELSSLDKKIILEEVPTFTRPLQKLEPVVMEQKTQKVVLKEDTVVQVPVNTYIAAPQELAPTFKDRTKSYPDTGYKEGYEALEQRRSALVEKPVRQRVVEDTSLPQSAVVSRDDKDERLVITKIIDKEAPVADPFAGRVLGHMDDRVLDDGYNGAVISAKLGMRVTKNSRPVSAWVEVFKNGTKQRVKTFYTLKGRKTKKVKLPAGNYMVRATYRTRDSKQQKTIKNIRLAEGGNVNKSIAFHDGKLRVVAMRGDDPLYVKVVAYKSGSRQRVSYDFSSRTSGVAELSLVSGTYDIEVIDHKNNRAFDSIRIRAGKTNTINADF